MSVAISNLATTWTNSGTTYTGIKLNVVDTASAAASLLMDLQVGGVSQFNVSKDGKAIAPVAAGYIGHRISSSRGSLLGAASTGGLAVGADGTICFTSGAPTGAVEVGLYRDAAQTLAQRNGTSAQTFRLYRSYTDASNYERGFLRWNSNVLEIGAEAAGTGTARSVWINPSATGNAALRLGGNSGGIWFTPANKNAWYMTTDGHFIAVLDNSYDIGATGANRPRNVFWAGYQEMSEMTAPAAPAANSVRIYAEDDGAGKTRLMARFATGAAVQIAIEP